VVKEQEPKQDDEMPTPTPHSDEVIQEPVSPAQQSKMRSIVFHFKFPMTP
jgi:hypothetical protein